MPSWISVEMEVETLAHRLSLAPKAEVLDLIKEIDEQVGEWNFTLRLAEHFSELKRQHEDEEAKRPAPTKSEER